MHAKRRRPWPVKAFVLVLTAGILFAAAAAVGVFYAVGGRWVVVQTPSMGEYAPVGTLVVSTPVGASGIRPGETILFHPPTSAGETYFHRVASVTPTAIRTRGDINGTIDPWILRPSGVVGHELFRLVGVGMLLQALPILLIGGVVLEILTHAYATREWAPPVRVLGWSVLVSTATVILQPLVRAVMLAQTTIGHAVTGILVPTGLLTIDAHAVHGSTAVLRPGEPGSVRAPASTGSGTIHVLLAPHIDVPTTAILIAVCLAPTVLCLAFALRRPPGRHSLRV